MSTYTSEPGTRLAGRYRLVDQMAAGSGWTMWKAMDETLARPVSVLTFAPGFPRIAQVVTAARAASRLTDPRLAQVFDVEDGGDHAAPGGNAGTPLYVVMEWVGGETLTDLLADSPLDPARACALVADAARALAGAHAAGQAHLRLTPETLRWTRSSGMKITGLGIDAALAGDGLTAAAASDPAAHRHPRPGRAAVRGADRLLARRVADRAAARADLRRDRVHAPAGHRGRVPGHRRRSVPRAAAAPRPGKGRRSWRLARSPTP